MAEKVSTIEKYNSVLPDATNAFLFKLSPLSQIKDDCTFVLDTNILLAPFALGSESVEELKNLYKRLTDDKRIFIPAQVAREYIANRANKIGDIREAIAKNISQSYQFLKPVPLLSDVQEYETFLAAENEVRKAIKTLKEAAKNVVHIMDEWAWNDPVSTMYQQLFAGSILSSDLDYKTISLDLNERNEWKLPPGHKDGGKSLNSGGDLVIWHEILHLAKSRNSHLIFVSHEEKNDWWHRSGNAGLYPRFELIDEFRRFTDGKSFHIINLSEMLDLFIDNQSVIKEVKEQEETNPIKAPNDGDLHEALVLAYNTRSSLLSFREICGERFKAITNRHKVQINDDKENPEFRIIDEIGYKNDISEWKVSLISEYVDKYLTSINHLRNILDFVNSPLFFSMGKSLETIPEETKDISFIISELSRLIAMLE